MSRRRCWRICTYGSAPARRGRRRRRQIDLNGKIVTADAPHTVMWWADEDGGCASGNEFRGGLWTAAWFAAPALLSFALLILALAC